MEKEKKNDSSQNVLNVILVIICGAIVGLFVYDYINKNDQIAEYKTEARQSREKASQERLDKANKLITLYKKASFNNVPEGLVSDEDNEQMKVDIAKNVSSNLSMIMAKMDKGQDITNDKLDKVQNITNEKLDRGQNITNEKLDRVMNITNEKLDKVMNELIALLEKETQKGVEIRKQMKTAIDKERKIEAKLQEDLTETQKVVTDLNGMVGELKALYVDAHEEDSALGDIGRVVNAVPKFVGNTLTFDWWASRDKSEAKKVIEAKQNDIMDRYDTIGDPTALKRIKVSQILRRNKVITKKQGNKKRRARKPRVAEPELILIQEVR
jgi:hypothetical protein